MHVIFFMSIFFHVNFFHLSLLLLFLDPESGRSLLWTLSPEEDCCCSWLHSCTNTNNTITNTVTIYFLNAFTTRDYDLRCQLGTADPTKKSFFFCNLVPYIEPIYTYIHTVTYIHIYNFMYRVNIDKK